MFNKNTQGSLGGKQRKTSFKQPSYLVIQGQVAFNSKHPSRNGKAISFLDEKVESKVQYRIPFWGLWRQSCEQTKGQKKTCLPLLVATPMYPKTVEVGRVALKVVNFWRDHLGFAYGTPPSKMMFQRRSSFLEWLLRGRARFLGGVTW